MPVAHVRCYEELNDFLPPERRKRPFDAPFKGRPAVKDLIESLGVPHTEIDLILVNGRSVGFGHLVADGDRISVYPAFEALDIAPLVRLRPKPLREPRFVLDAHLGRLARYLRLLGLDALYRNDYGDTELARISRDQHSILLTRDVGLLKRSAVTHGHFVRATAPRAQAIEILRRFDLLRACAPFTRCLNCNGLLEDAGREHVQQHVPPGARGRFDRFRRCRDCAQVYWSGSHYPRLERLVAELLEAAG